MLIQGKTGISSGTDNRRKRHQVERLWILEGRCLQGHETFVTGLSQGQMRGQLTDLFARPPHVPSMQWASPTRYLYHFFMGWRLVPTAVARKQGQDPGASDYQ